MSNKTSTKQNINGILLVNKPFGITSNDVLQQVKRLFNAKKAGHTGSLDPMATGMLPICFGEATKFSQFLLDADKCYEATGLLGIQTNTGDAMGKAIARARDFVPVPENILQNALTQFRGTIQQVPSMFSALKHEGKPLYQYARAGVDVPREARPVNIYSLELNRFNGREMSLTVTCSKGTYIRNLIEDIGERLGTGAHVTRLHRLYTAGLSEEKMYTINELRLISPEERISLLLPVDRAVNHLPQLSVTNDEALSLTQGKSVNLLNMAEPGWVRLYQNSTHFIGLGDLLPDGLLKAKRMLAT